MAYNGYPSYNAWNVSLWLQSDEGLYNLMLSIIKRNRRRYGNKKRAPKEMLDALHGCKVYKTDDGVRYTVSNIRRAMEGL